MAHCDGFRLKVLSAAVLGALASSAHGQGTATQPAADEQPASQKEGDRTEPAARAADGSGVLAQAAPQDTTLPEVKVQAAPARGEATNATRSATRTDTPLRDIPQFINTVPESLIRSQGGTTLVDALRNVPGISYAAAEGGTQANTLYYLRGFPSGGDLFMDGIRDLGEYTRDLFNIESVEVLKGPSSLTFGRGSTGGVINQNTRVPTLFGRSEVALTVGSYDQLRFTGDLNFRTGDASALRVVGLVEDSNTYRYPQDVERTGLAPSFRFGINTDTDITLAHSYLKTKDVTDYGQPTLFTAATGFFGFAPVPAEAYYGYANHDFADHTTQITTARIDHRFGRSLSLRNTTRWATYKRRMEATISTLRATDINGAAVTAATPLELLVVTRNHDTNRSRDNDDDALVNQTELTWKLATGGVRHTVLGGLELARERLNRHNNLLDADPNTAGAQAPTSITPLLAPDPYTQLSYTKTPNQRAIARGETVAVYTQDQVQFSRAWKALLGLRWEHYEASTQTIAIAPTATSSGPFGRTDSMVSGRAGVIWQPGDRSSYYVSWGNSYNPSGELGVYGGTATNLNLVNQTLEPEKNDNYEVGAQWDFESGLRIRSALFRTEKNNARMADPATGTTVLAGKRRVDGVEVEVVGTITRSWEIASGIAYMDGEIVKGPANVEGKRPLGVASLSGNVWTVYRLGGGFEVGGGVRGNSGAYTTDTNLAKLPRYHVWDLMVAWVQPNYEVRVNLNNVTDERYYYGGYQNSPNRVLPGAPRTVSLTARYQLD